MDEAVEAAEEWCNEGSWDQDKQTVWVGLNVRNLETDESRRITVTMEPNEPKCTEPEHAWADYRVHGHGGGVICTDTCSHCGIVRKVDTWAQNPETGEQGLHSTEYSRDEN